MNYNDSVTGQEEEAWNNDMSDFDTDFSGECEWPLLSLGMCLTPTPSHRYTTAIVWVQNRHDRKLSDIYAML